MRTIAVAIDSALFQTFDYLPAPATTIAQYLPGARVLVPFGKSNKLIVGIVIAASSSSLAPPLLKKIKQLLDIQPLISEELFALLRWAAAYYFCPIGHVLTSALPSILRSAVVPDLRQRHWSISTKGSASNIDKLQLTQPQQRAFKRFQQFNFFDEHIVLAQKISISTVNALTARGLLDISTKTLALPARPTASKPLQQLSAEQQHALQVIQQSFASFAVVAVDGVTGSGKTDVYIHAITAILARQKTALVLVPEIGLTPQTVSRFQACLNTHVIEMHSGMKPQQRLQQWQLAQLAEAGLVIGTRSALFTPLPNLGIIIIDEEHDGSFKQNDGFRYHARDLAIKRAQLLNIPVVLGSATLSLETIRNIAAKRFKHVVLRNRPSAKFAPIIQCVDTSTQHGVNSAGLHAASIQAIRTHIAAGNQVMIYINRRGYAPTLHCWNCGWQATCENCDANLTIHQQPLPIRLHCHLCGHNTQMPVECPNCLQKSLLSVGSGSQRIEDNLQRYFADVDIVRVDSNTMRGKDAFRKLYKRVHQQQPMILVGTQMLSKGHDFHNITLVVIVQADGGLFSADFKAPEHTCQQLLQVIGRVGRGDKQGTAILQTALAHHRLISQIITNNYANICKELLPIRQQQRLPPYSQLALFRVESQNIKRAQDGIHDVFTNLHAALPQQLHHYVFAPSQPERNKIKLFYRWQIIINAPSHSERNAILRQLCIAITATTTMNRTRWHINVDPFDLQ